MSKSNSENEDGSKTCIKPRIVSNIKAASMPAVHALRPSGASLKEQASAPSYFHSLKENEAPPFKKPGQEAKPRLLIGTLITENDVVEIVAAMDTLNGSNIEFKRKLADMLVKKNIVASHHITEKCFLVSLLLETVGYAAQRGFSKVKLACLLSVYLSTHLYFRWYYLVSPAAVWQYFRRVMVKHAIEDSPDGQEVFEPEECYDIMSHFHTNYISNLPLVHILTFDVHRLKLSWPFKNK